MKSSLFTLLFVCSVGLLQAQNVVFNDANFKAALVNNSSINTNGDSEIQLSEAQAATATAVVAINQGITDITGIEEFVNARVVNVDNNAIVTADLRNLTQLSAFTGINNQLTSLLIATNNTSLVSINARNNQLTSIDLTNALGSIRTLDLSYNQLTSIDISSLDTDAREVYLNHNQLTSLIFPSSSALTKFNCSHNQLTNLRVPLLVGLFDCGNNPLDSLWVQNASSRLTCDSSQLRYLQLDNDVDTLICSYNNLTKLNFNLSRNYNYIDCRNNSIDSIRSTNTTIKYLNASNNNLRILGVDNANNNNVFIVDASGNSTLFCIQTNRNITNAQSNWILDSQTSMSNDCASIWSSVSTIPTLPNVNLYPNPTTNNVQLDLGQIYEEVVIVVYNNLGQELFRTQQNFTEQIHVHLPKNKGIYITKVQTEKGQAVFKVIKE